MKNTLLLLLVGIFLSSQIVAQTPNRYYCNTQSTKSAWLTEFQQHPEAHKRTNVILYIPLTIHLVGSDAGDAYYPMQELLDDICHLNQAFEDAEIQFFLEGEVHYIQNSDWYSNPTSAMMIANNVENTVNCYFVNYEFGGFYSSAGDGVVVSRWALDGTETVWQHELGHYFSLPHTFLGWEGSNYYNYSSPAPEFIGGETVERVDGQNCATAADGFCDTNPDYLWFGYWTCLPNKTSQIVQTDPTGTTFRSDGSLFMSYSLCADRFSDMQILAVRANITNVRPNLLYNQNPLTEIDEDVILLSPSQGMLISSDEPLTLEWDSVSNATHYLVQLTFLPYFSTVYDQYIVQGSSLTINNLLPNKNYRWRVRPYNVFHTCASYSEEGLFSTGEIIACEKSEIIGTTVYDLQTNASVCNRISRDAEGNIMATWTMGFEHETGYPDRGTGYNKYDIVSETWKPIPTERLEQNTRTGWPNHIITDSGTELIVTHVFTNQGIFLHTLRKEAGSQNWVENQVPTNTPSGVITARMSSSGETIHLIAVTAPVNFGGLVYEGVNGHILYYRSSDAGASWEIIDDIIPGLDNSFLADLGGIDSYAIDARGDVVAVGVFSQINDVRIFKSEDKGNSWNHTRIHDFPIDMYQTDQGYTLTDLPPPDAQQPDPLAIFTTDNSGTILIDKNELIHAFYAQMYIKDTNTQDGFIVNYPGTDGLSYWNETFGTDSTRTIAGVLDLNGNGIIDIERDIHLPGYQFSMSSTPSSAVDENNNIYMAYSMVMEGAAYRQNNKSQQYRHIMIIHSEDGGETWSEPFDAVNAACTGDTDLSIYKEAVFPSMVRDIDDEIMFLYQQDFRPGLSTGGGGDPPETNFIRFVRIDVSELGIVKAKEVVKSKILQVTVYPNPTDVKVTVSFELERSTQVNLSLFNLIGQKIRSNHLDNLPKGKHQFQFDMENLPSGVYLLELNTGYKMTVTRIVVN